MKCVLRVESGESRLQHSPAASSDGPGTGLGVVSVSVSEKSNTDTDQPQLKQLETKSGWGLIPASVQNTFMS